MKLNQHGKPVRASAPSKCESLLVGDSVSITEGKFRGATGEIVGSGHGFFSVRTSPWTVVMKRSSELEREPDPVDKLFRGFSRALAFHSRLLCVCRRGSQCL
jgi:hypothetical protein